MKKNVTDPLLDNAPCGYLQIDNTGVILKMNKTLRRWLGFEVEEEIDAMSLENLFNMGGKIFCQTHMLPLLKMHGEISEINQTLVAKNATTFPVLINAKKDDLKVGEKQTFSVFILDITQRKMYEKELLKERKNAEVATERLKQINKDLEQFAYTAAHDLQGPLRTISGMINLIEKKKIIEPDSEGMRIFSFIKSNTDQMRMMVGDLLEYSKVDDNQSDYSPVSLKEIIEQAIDLLKNDIEKNRAIFDISEMPIVSGSKSQLLRLFQNLFENSIKYRSDTPPEIKVTNEINTHYYEIQIKDNGVGFDNKFSQEIFTFMRRLNNVQNIPGSGIGLSTCQRIMKNHGGLINAESESGKGSVFKLQFPR